MIATVDIADIGAVPTLRSLVAGGRARRDVAGLRWSELVALADLAATRPPRLRRAALLAFWDDADAASTFRAGHRDGQRLVNGIQLDLRPIRLVGSWPGLPPASEVSDDGEPDAPVVVLTLGHLRLSQAVRFLRTSRPAEHAAVSSPSMRWGTAVARPPFVATISVWESGAAAATYALGRSVPAHSNAVAEQRRKDFHRQSAFVRFRPLRMQGSLDGVDLGLGPTA